MDPAERLSPTSIPRIVVSVISVLASSCGGSAMMPSPPINVTGTWIGVVGGASGDGRALRVTWTATQDGTTASGPASVVTSPPVTDVIFSGTLTGRISGSAVSLSLSAEPLRGSNCSLSGAGSAAVATGTIAGSLDVHFTSCGALEPPASNQIVLTRQ
jgi:hypothetical protein